MAGPETYRGDLADQIRYNPPTGAPLGGNLMPRVMSGGAGAGQVERESIVSVLDRQAELISGAHNMLNGLENRLGLILAPPPPESSSENTKRLDPSTILERLYCYNRAIESLTRRIDALDSRVQL